MVRTFRQRRVNPQMAPQQPVNPQVALQQPVNPQVVPMGGGGGGVGGGEGGGEEDICYTVLVYGIHHAAGEQYRHPLPCGSGQLYN